MRTKTNWKYLLIIFVLATIIAGGTFWLANQIDTRLPNFLSPKYFQTSKEIQTNQEFRDLIVRFVRKIAENKIDNKEVISAPEKLLIKGDWNPYLTIYYQGEIISQSQAQGTILSKSLEKAVESAFTKTSIQNLTKEEFGKTIFLVNLFDSSEQFSFVEHNGQGKELINDLTVVRELDKDLIKEKIKQGAEFLYRVENQDKHGFYKKYDALEDSMEERLYGPYSASIIYTFLYLYDLDEDQGQEILGRIEDWTDFLFSMQNQDKESKTYGAFSYSYYLDSGEKEERFVVGTSALTIFTLLKLYDLTNEKKYLDSAKLAGDWLLSMQRTDGVMKPYACYSPQGKWLYGQKESLLYEGQVLSSLSKLYGVTNDRKYLDCAEKIAKRFAEKYEKEQGYIQGEYRKKNPISNSWVVMSLIDFCKVKPVEEYKNIIFELSTKVLENQKNDSQDLYYYGSWGGAYSSSGTGWINEVMGETYRFCKQEKWKDCDKYKNAMIKAMRWLIQNTYSEENVFFLPNPEMAKGGVFWNANNKYVRTDSVCHALNGYIRIFNNLEYGSLLSIPEQPFDFISQ